MKGADKSLASGILSITDVALVDGWRDNHVLIFYTGRAIA
jgi:hypothetical protein